MIFITGVSRGLGKAIAELYLSKGEKVTGIGRSTDLAHSNFSFLKCDLSDLDAVRNMEIPSFDEPITLINNAGIIGEISRLSDMENVDVDQVMTVNVSAPVILTQKVYKDLKNKDAFTLVNISSGAANRAIPSWASYCASKAALNMHTETFLAEEQEKGHAPKVYAVAPGVIDTGMQTQIRAANPENFSGHENFKSLKEDGNLFSSEEAAKRLSQLLHFEYVGGVFHDLREITVQ
ncbi:MAG: SDR family NAD(P)-dependent oxidoreductase [Crocinitomicaceae bacterium]|nr:SDR family NAD(P)-dependent oxidoreductase [Crocinitomicaceae bacterium]